MLPIGLASDHAGFALKQAVKEYLESHHLPFHDYGTLEEVSCDYPDYAHALANGLLRGECERGIALCGSGEGIAMTLNKHSHIRAALVWMPEIAKMTRQHNDANVLVLPGRYMSSEMADKCLDEFLNTPFEGGRHQKRVEKIPIKV